MSKPNYFYKEKKKINRFSTVKLVETIINYIILCYIKYKKMINKNYLTKNDYLE